MRTLGRQAARRSRPHFPQACPLFHGRVWRRKWAIPARVPPLPSAAPGVDNPPFRARQVQLVWSEIPRQPKLSPYAGGGVVEHVPQQLHDDAAATAAAGPQLAHVEAVELMRRIKAARSWHQLQSIVDGNLLSMNHLHVSAVLTHMAQLHASSSTGSNDGGFGGTAGGHSDSRSGVWQQHHEGDDCKTDAFNHHRSSAAAGGRLLHPSGSRLRGHHTQEEAPNSSGGPYVPEVRAHVLQVGPLQLPLHISTHAANGRSRPPPPPHQDSQASALQHSLQASSHHRPHLQQQQHHRPADPRVVFLQRLEHAVAAHLPDFEGRQLANTLWAVAKLGHRPSERWLELLLTRASTQFHTFNPQHLANTLYALMLLRYMPPGAWLEDFYAAVSGRLHGFRPGELSHLCYAAGKLGLQPGRQLLGGVLHHSMLHMQSYGIRELALLLYGVVHMGAQLHADWVRVYRRRVTDLAIGSGALPAPLLERLAGQASQRELSRLARAQLEKQQQGRERQDHALQGNDGHEQQRPRHGLGVARHGSHHIEDAWVPSVRNGTKASGVIPALPTHGSLSVSPAAAAVRAVAAGGSSAEPPAAVVEASAPRAVWVASYLPTILCSLAEIGYRPPPVFMSTVLAAVGSAAGELTPVGLTTVLLSLANMRYRPHPALFRRIWNLLMDRLNSLQTQQCTVALWASATLGCCAPRGDVAAILANAAARLPDYADSELLQLLEAASALEFEPTTSWLELIESDLYNRLPRMRPQEAAALLLPLADLGHKPHRLWMARWAEALTAGLQGLELRHLTAAMYGAARLGFRPPSRLRSELLAQLEAGMAAAAATATQQQQQQEEVGVLDHGQSARGEQKPRRVRPAWKTRLGDRVRGLIPETFSRLMWALAVLDIRPDAGWLSGYMACLRLVHEDLSDQERAKVGWALARLRYDPGPKWAEEVALWRDTAFPRQQQEQQQQVLRLQRRRPHGGEPAAVGLVQHHGAKAAAAQVAGAAAAAEVAAAATRTTELRVLADSGRCDDDAEATAEAESGLIHGGSPTATEAAADAVSADSAEGSGALRNDGRVTAAGLSNAETSVHWVRDSSSSDINSVPGLDVNTFVLLGIQKWAARQLRDMAPATAAAIAAAPAGGVRRRPHAAGRVR